MRGRTSASADARRIASAALYSRRGGQVTGIGQPPGAIAIRAANGFPDLEVGGGAGQRVMTRTVSLPAVRVAWRNWLLLMRLVVTSEPFMLGLS